MGVGVHRPRLRFLVLVLFKLEDIWELGGLGCVRVESQLFANSQYGGYVELSWKITTLSGKRM